MGNPEECQKHTKLPQVPQLLLTLHQRIRGLHEAVNLSYPEGLQVEVGRTGKEHVD
jgi:hypothetical protein